MIVNCNGENLLSLILPYYIIIQELLYLLGLKKIDITCIGKIIIIILKFFLYDISAQFDSFIANIYVIGACNKFADLILPLSAEGAEKFILCVSCHDYSSVLFVTTLSIIPKASASSAESQLSLSVALHTSS